MFLPSSVEGIRTASGNIGQASALGRNMSASWSISVGSAADFGGWLSTLQRRVTMAQPPLV